MCENLYRYHIYHTVKWVNEIFKGKVIFCGSFGLAMNDLLNRNIGDIDCITEVSYYGVDPEKYLPYEDLPNHLFDIYKSNSRKMIINNVEVKCFKLVSPYGISVDVMYREDKTKFHKKKYHGKLVVKVDDPENAIEAKKAYVEKWRELEGATGKSVDKHLTDLKYISDKGYPVY